MRRFYELLQDLALRLGGTRTLADCAATDWPAHGVYFFFEPGQLRVDGTPRIVRVGTHALRPTSHTTLWTRLAQHRGQVAGERPGGGNHRGSVFRHHVGTALLASGSWPEHIAATWRQLKVDRTARQAEYPLERAVSDHIGKMPLVWLPVTDRHLRGLIERNSIALLSCRSGCHDQPSHTWLGLAADNHKVRTSGLWNSHHVDDHYEEAFLDELQRLADRV